MTRVLVVWEDTYFQPLDEILNRTVSKLTPDVAASRPTVLHHTARSNTAFERYVETTWPIASTRGLPMNPGAINHVVCVADADKLAAVLRQHVPPPPKTASNVAAWHTSTERAWNSHLRSKCPKDGPPITSVHGVVLRWSKESMLLSGYDQPSFAQHLDCGIVVPGIEQFLKECTPAPSELDGDSFSNHFRNPTQCLRALRKAANLPELPKNSPQVEDALRKLGRESLGTLCERTPDIPRVAKLIWELHTTVSAPPDPANAVGTPQGSTPKQTQSRARPKKSGRPTMLAEARV